MSEYIFCVPDENQPIAGDSSVYYPDERDEPMRVLGEIVRCMDCKWFTNSSHYGAYCTNFGTPLNDDYDGFCAWGEKRTDE